MTIILLTITGFFLLLGYISEWRLHRFCKGIERDLNRFPLPKKRLTKQIKIKFDTACSFGGLDAGSEEHTKALIRTGFNHYRLTGLSLFQAEHLWAWFAGICMLPGTAAWILAAFLPAYAAKLGIIWEQPLTAGILSVLFLALCDRFYDNAGYRIRLETMILDKLTENNSAVLRNQKQYSRQSDSFTEGPDSVFPEETLHSNASARDQSSPVYSAALTRTEENENTSHTAANRSSRSGTERRSSKNTVKRAADTEERLVSEMMDYFTQD